jgi:5-(carboxyamino)imidazole ribonucleotide synthase
MIPVSTCSDRRPVVGVIGAGPVTGQLAEAAVRLGIDLRVLAAPGEGAVPARWAGTEIGDHRDLDVLERFSAGCDALLLTHGQVAVAHVERLEALGVAVLPSSRALRLADPAAQRRALADAGIRIPPFELVRSSWGTILFAERTGGWPLVLRPVDRADGASTHHVADAREAAMLLEPADGRVWVAEQRVPVEAELAVVVMTTAEGGRRIASLGQPRRGEGPAAVALPDAIGLAVTSITDRVADVVGTVGALRIELFISNGRPVVHAVAPHLHACIRSTPGAGAASLLEDHLRAAVGWASHAGRGDATLVGAGSARADRVGATR